MMFIDASALVAILTLEDDARKYAQAISDAPVRQTSPLAVWETVVAVARKLNYSVPEARNSVITFLRMMRIDIVAIPPEAAHLAVEAFDRFGKGRHAAALNMGDCFAWACARHYQAPLLYKGGDFDLTGIARA